MTTSNPTLGAFGRIGMPGVTYVASDTMTVAGTINKTGILTAVLALCFALGWSQLTAGTVPSTPFIIITALGGFVIAMIICFQPQLARYLSGIYAAAEGFLMAAISYPLEQAFPHIVLQAASLTVATLFALLLAYRSGLIVVNATFRAVIVGATMTILLYYVAGFLLGFAHVNLPGLGFEGGWLSIGISVVIVIVAALNFVLDFDYIANAAGRAPKYMEWYGAFSLLVTMVWLYLEILRLLAKLRSR
jgi:uncharacterized YccA/Bax inhibitor family protein